MSILSLSFDDVSFCDAWSWALLVGWVLLVGWGSKKQTLLIEFADGV